MDLISTLPGSMMEGYFPAGWDLAKIDRTLLTRLETLDREEVRKATGNFLTKSELDAMMVRRDMLVAHFKKLVADLGEDKVLY